MAFKGAKDKHDKDEGAGKDVDETKAGGHVRKGHKRKGKGRKHRGRG